MRKFAVKLNGVVYDVEVEEMSAEQVSRAQGAAPAPVPAAAPAPAPAAAPAPAPAAAPAPASGKGTKITSPMPGTILDVKVKQGDTVKSGDVLFIIEAMKLESEIVSPCDGIVGVVAAIRGKSVNSGETLCVIS